MADRASAVHLPPVAGMAGVVAVVAGAYFGLSLPVTAGVAAAAAAAAAGVGAVALLGAAADGRQRGAGR